MFISLMLAGFGYKYSGITKIVLNSNKRQSQFLQKLIITKICFEKIKEKVREFEIFWGLCVFFCTFLFEDR
jgi:hypothetical protein